MLKVTVKIEVIQELLVRKGKTRSWLAYKLEISAPYASQILNGSRNPSAQIRGKLLRIFKGSKFDDLFIIHK